MTAPLLVALAPSARRPHATALDGPSGDRLAALAGLPDRRRLFELFDAINLCPTPTVERSSVLRARARSLLDASGGRVIVAVGAHVAVALLGAAAKKGLFALSEVRAATGDVRVWCIPHASCRNRALNSAHARARTGETLRATLSQPALEPTLLDYAAAAALSGIDVARLRYLVHVGRVKHIRLGPRTVRFRADDLVGIR